MNAPDPIATFMPWLQDDERAMRQRILKARDTSAARAVLKAPSRSADLLWMANEIANERAFAPASMAELGDVVTALERLFSAARAMEIVEMVDARA